jgi:hypothetical protein
MNRKLRIPAGGMFQEWNCLIDLHEYEKAEKLESLASSNGWREITACDAESMGFCELAEWSIPQTDVLILVDNTFLVCIPKKTYYAVEC